MKRTNKDPTRRIYPACCTSANCGRGSCDGCRNKPTLDEFKAWRDRTGAKPKDPIWCPTVYYAGGEGR